MNNYCHTDLIAKGWECPKCQAVMAPNHPTCWYCKPIQINTVTSGSSVTLGSTVTIPSVPEPYTFGCKLK